MKTKNASIYKLSEDFRDHFFSASDEDNKEVVLNDVKRDGWGLQYASDRLRNDKDVVLNAVASDGWVLKYASKKMQDDKEVVIVAVSGDGAAIKFASDRLKKDQDVIKAACKKDIFAVNYLDDSIKQDKSLMAEIIDTNPSASYYVEDSGLTKNQIASIIANKDELLNSDIRHLEEVLKGMTHTPTPEKTTKMKVETSASNIVKPNEIEVEDKIEISKPTELEVRVEKNVVTDIEKAIAIDNLKAEIKVNTPKTGSNLSI